MQNIMRSKFILNILINFLNGEIQLQNRYINYSMLHYGEKFAIQGKYTINFVVAIIAVTANIVVGFSAELKFTI